MPINAYRTSRKPVVKIDVPKQFSRQRSALTLSEVLIVAVLTGIVAAIALSRWNNASTARKGACYTLKGNLEVQAQLWRRQKGAWPAADLSDLAADVQYLPDGLPVCPVDGSTYSFDPASHRVVGHSH